MVQTFLVRRGRTGLFSFRLAVPKRHREALGRQELWIALGTDSYRLARRQAALMWVKLQELFDMAELPKIISIKDILDTPSDVLPFHVHGLRIENGSMSCDGIDIDPEKQGDSEAAMAFLAGLSQPSTTSTKSSSSVTISVADAWDKWLESDCKGLQEKTLLMNKGIGRVLVKFIGDKSVSTLEDYELVNRFLDTLCMLPPNFSKKAGYVSCSLEEVAEDNKRVDGPVISLINYNKYVARLTQFAKWCKVRKYITGENPFIGHKKKIRDRANSRRVSYTVEELIKIFSPSNYWTCDKIKGDNYKYWLPLLGLFTGARLGELCQLRLVDVVLDTDIPFITITGDGDNQSVKNVPSERIVPLHKNIMQLDFKEYVTYLKKNGADRLFPELAYRSIDGYMRGASRWYSYEMDKANIMYVDEKTKTKKRKTFHCFRHTLPTVLDNLEDLSSNVISDVMGHTRRGTETNKTYIDSKKLTELYKAIEKLPYDFVLELAHWQK